MKQLRFFLLALLIIVSLAACIQNTGPHKGEGIPLTTTYPQQKGSEIITTFDSSYITAITYPPETDSSVTEGSVTDPPVDELVIPNTIILEPFPGNPLENFIPTSIVDYNDLTVISDGIISYICTPKGEVIYIVEGTVQRCRHCGVIYYQYHIGFNIRLEQDGKYRFYPHQNYGHGDGRGAYVYDITEKMVYSISAGDAPPTIKVLADNDYYSADTLYPAIAMNLPKGFVENFNPSTFDFDIIKGKYGLADKYGNIVVPFEYDSIRKNGDYYLAFKAGVYSFILPDGTFYKDTFLLAGAPFSNYFDRTVVAWVYDEEEGCRMITVEEIHN